MKEGVQLLKGKGPFMWPVLLSQSEKSASLSCQHSCVWRCQALRQEYTPFAQIFALIYSVLRSRRCQKSEPEWSQRWQISQEIAYDGHRHVLFSFVILVVKSHVSAWDCCVTTWWSCDPLLFSVWCPVLLLLLMAVGKQTIALPPPFGLNFHFYMW